MTKMDVAIRKTAAKLIQKYGQLVELTHKSQTYFPDKGEMVDDEIKYQTVRAVVDEFRVGFQDNTSVQAGDLKVTIAAEALENDPVPGDTVKIGEEVYSIVPPVTPTYVNEQVGVWNLQVRK